MSSLCHTSRWESPLTSQEWHQLKGMICGGGSGLEWVRRPWNVLPHIRACTHACPQTDRWVILEWWLGWATSGGILASTRSKGLLSLTQGSAELFTKRRWNAADCTPGLTLLWVWQMAIFEFKDKIMARCKGKAVCLAYQSYQSDGTECSCLQRLHWVSADCLMASWFFLLRCKVTKANNAL